MEQPVGDCRSVRLISGEIRVIKDLIYSGRFVAADQALKLGLVGVVAPRDR
ncbi:MAG: hypothetical protein ACLP7F_18785 [Acidimicrobiales bacterium]